MTSMNTESKAELLNRELMRRQQPNRVAEEWLKSLVAMGAVKLPLVDPVVVEEPVAPVVQADATEEPVVAVELSVGEDHARAPRRARCECCGKLVPERVYYPPRYKQMCFDCVRRSSRKYRLTDEQIRTGYPSSQICSACHRKPRSSDLYLVGDGGWYCCKCLLSRRS